MGLLRRPSFFLLAAGALLLSGCDKDSANETDHEHEAQTAQITVWENGYEAFVEHKYPVAAVPVRLITHISEIATGFPRRAGPVTFRLAGPSGAALEHTEEKPARDGIYLPTLTFPAAGQWKVTIEVPASSGAAQIHLPEIAVYTTADEAAHAPAQAEPGGVSFLKEQQWKLSMLTVPVERRSLTARKKFPGRVKPRTGSRVAVSAPLVGRIVAPSEPLPRVGEAVEAGRVLSLVEPSLPSADLLSLEVKLAEAEADEIRTAQALKLAEAALARNQRLAKANAKSARELERAQFEAESAKAAHEAAAAVKTRYRNARAYVEEYRPRADRNSHGFGPLPLRAPISGTLVAVNAVPGERVTPAEDLFVILDASAVYVEARVPEYEANRLGNGPHAYLEIPNAANGESSRLPLELIYAGLEVDESRTVGFLYQADNARALLRIGMSVEVLIEAGSRADVIAIPKSSLVDEDGRYVAFVQISGEAFERHELRLGARDRGLFEVLDGISEGERVVTSEPWSIRLASLSTVIPAHGHEH